MKKARTLARDDGFTLAEMMVVILIIGILVGIAVVSFAFSVSTSKRTACSANLRIIRDQVSIYNSEFNSFPPTLQDLVPDYIDKEDRFFCPDSGEAYIYDEETGEISCPFHDDI